MAPRIVLQSSDGFIARILTALPFPTLPGSGTSTPREHAIRMSAILAPIRAALRQQSAFATFAAQRAQRM
jgi:hypothetical protein